MLELHTAAIALGANLPSAFGEPRETLLAAIERIGSLGRVISASSFLLTEPVGYKNQPQFLNGAVLVQTSLAPLELMHALLAIETTMGRVRSGVPAKGPRIIDLDLIFYDSVVVVSDELTLPHPAMGERMFVLAPLAEIAASWVHPVNGLSVQDMLRRVQLGTDKRAE